MSDKETDIAEDGNDEEYHQQQQKLQLSQLLSFEEGPSKRAQKLRSQPSLNTVDATVDDSSTGIVEEDAQSEASHEEKEDEGIPDAAEDDFDNESDEENSDGGGQDKAGVDSSKLDELLKSDEAQQEEEGDGDGGIMEEMQNTLIFFNRQASESKGDANFAKIQGDYEKLHRIFLVSRSNEKKLVKRCRDLALELQANASKVQAALKISQNDRGTITALKKEVRKAWKMVETVSEKEARAKEAIISMKSEIESLRKNADVANVASKPTTSYARQKNIEFQLGQENTINELVQMKGSLQQEADVAHLESKNLKQDISDLEGKLYTAATDRGSLDHEVLNLKDLLATKKSEMDRDTRTREKLEMQLRAAVEASGKKDIEVQSKLTEVKQLKEQVSRTESILRDERQKFEKSEGENESITTRLARVQQEYDEQVFTISSLMNDTQHQGRELKKWEEELQKYKDELRNVTRVRDTLHKRIKVLEEFKIEADLDNDGLRGINHSVLHDLDIAKKELEHSHKLIEGLKRERDIAQKNFVRATGATQKQVGAVKLADQTKRNLEQEILSYKDEASKMRKLIYSLEKDRDRHITAAGNAEHNLIGKVEEVKIKEMHIFDSKKKITEMEKKLKEQQTMYESVRTERNLYSKNCIEFEDEIIEMKRKLKIMGHQIEQLKEEISNMEQALVKENFEHSQLEKEKESLSSQIGKLQLHHEEAQKMIRNQQAEENKLRHIITETDAERLRQKKDYEAVVQERDILGTQLIRRNDELSLLYEKIKIQTSTLNKGELQYRERLEDIRVLRLEIKKLRREKAILQTETQNVEGLRTEIFKLQRETLRERTRVKVLEEELESPMNIHRWRKLSGSDPSTFELITKIQTLQKRLISKTEEVVEKELIISQKEKLYKEVKEVLQRQPGPEIAEELRIVKEAVKVKMRECKSLASELNMYHSQVNEYKFEIERLTKELQEMKKRYYEHKKKEREDRKQRDFENSGMISSSGGIKGNHSGPKFAGGGFNLTTGPHQATHYHVPPVLPSEDTLAFHDLLNKPMEVISTAQ